MIVYGVQGTVLVEGAATYQILEDRSSSSLKSTLAILHTVQEDFGSYEVPSNALSSAKDLNFDTFFLMISYQGEQLTI